MNELGNWESKLLSWLEKLPEAEMDELATSEMTDEQSEWCATRDSSMLFLGCAEDKA